MKGKTSKRAASKARLKQPAKRTRLPRPLTREDKLKVFLRATRGLVVHYASEIRIGMTDEELTAALQRCMGIGGGGGPGQPWEEHNGAGLRIWGSWQCTRVKDPPLFAGRSILAMARLTYGVPDPTDMQLPLFAVTPVPTENQRRTLSTKKTPAR